MRRRDVLRTGGLAAAALAAPAIRSAEAQTGKTLVIGGSVPLTGAAAETGLNVNNGYITAATYFNEVLGGVEIAGEKYKIELKLFDDASDPARATTLIQRQIDEGTDFFLGIVRQQHRAATAAITERAKKPMVQTGGGSTPSSRARTQIRVRHVSARHAPVRRDGGAVQDAAADAADLLGDLHQRRFLQDRRRRRASVVRCRRFQAHRQLRAAGQTDRRVERAGSVRANTPTC